MPLSPGQKIGPYEVLSSLGAGGMGEVYRAHDTKLNRDVALKLLPEVFANDANRLGRFTREAQTLASLNHPHIAQIYGLEETNGVRALVMELIEGEDLSDRIALGPIPIDEALPIATQITEALESAHEHGIVHRDLKPSNIKLTANGTVKLLDFGLAKAMGGDSIGTASTSPDASKSPTRSDLMTEGGMILGTVAYMSPEQAKGKAVDKRADIWAFGVVFFEMLTGKHLFCGETISDVLVAVLTHEPEWKSLPSTTPKSIRALIRRCLERDPQQRLRDIGEARIALTQKAEPDVPVTSSIGTSNRARYWIGAAILSLVVGAGAYFAGRLGTAPRAVPSASVLNPQSFTLLTDQSGVESEPCLSPDGRNLSFVKETKGQLDIHIVRVGGRNTVNLTSDSPSDDFQPAFSPDGESIAFRSDRDQGGIFIMGSTGESVRRITDFGYDPAWSPDGKKLVLASASFTFPQDRPARSTLSIVDISTGSKQPLTQQPDAVQPSWSPHGYRIAYWGLREGTGRRDIWTIAADGSESKTAGVEVTNDAYMDWSPTWSPDGAYLYFSSNRGGTLNLWRIGIEERSGRVHGEPESLTAPAGWAGDPTVSSDGKHLAFASLEWRSRLQTIPIDPVGEKVLGAPVSIHESSYPIRDHSVSPNGQWLAFNAFAGAKEDLFVVGIDGTRLRRLTDDEARDRGPVWNPDNQQIIFYSDRVGNYEVWTIRADGSGLEQITRNAKYTNLPACSPDGRRIAASYTGAGGGWGLIDVNSRQVIPMPQADGETRFWPLSWSPDGLRIAGELLRTDGKVADLAIFILGEKKFQRLGIQPSGHVGPTQYLSDSRRLLFRDRRGIFLVDSAIGKAMPLISIGGYYTGRSLSISADDKTISYSQTATEGDIWMTELTSPSTTTTTR